MVKIINIENSNWNSYVRRLDNYDVFYLREYAIAFMNENKENGIPLLFVYENKDDYAINVVFMRSVRDVPFYGERLTDGEYYDFVSPYGYGGFIGHISDYIALNQEYEDICRKKGMICEFVRFELFTDYHKHYDGEVETRIHNVVRSLEMPLDEMWMDFKQKVRKNVKKANKFGLQIVIENTDEHLSDFLDIYYSTMERSSAESEYYFSKEFFETLNRMKDNVMYFYVLHEGKVISAELVIYGAENCYSYLGGTNKEYFDLRPNDFLKYEIIKWAREKGLKRFVLGGGYGSDDGIFQYKTCLAPNGIVDFYIGRKIFDREKYDYLLSIRKEDKKPVNEKYFPVYRS